MEPQAEPQHSPCSLPDASLHNLFPSGVVSGYQPTCLLNRICMESTTTGGSPVADSQPEEANSIGNSRKKRQRRKHAQHWQQFTRAQFQAVDSRQNLDSNQSNQSYIRSSTRTPRTMYACTSGISGYIKGVEQPTEPFGLGLAKV